QPNKKSADGNQRPKNCTTSKQNLSTRKQKLSTSYPQASQRHSKLSTTYPQAESNVCSAGRGRGANVCSSRRAPKRFLQIFKTRVIKLLYPTYPNDFQRIPPSSKLIILQLNVSQRPPPFSNVIQSQ